MYYDNEEQYVRLQKLKQQVDPDDLFHTSLTVKVPDSVVSAERMEDLVTSG